MEGTIELHLPSRLGWERAAMDLAAGVARRMGFPPDRIDDIKTAVSEATTNAIEHGNRKDPSRKVALILMPGNGQLEIRVADQSGVPAPLFQAPRGRARLQKPDLAAKLRPGANTRGWGLFLIMALVDEVEFASTGEGNHVRMVLRLQRPV